MEEYEEYDKAIADIDLFISEMEKVKRKLIAERDHTEFNEKIEVHNLTNGWRVYDECYELFCTIIENLIRLKYKDQCKAIDKCEKYYYRRRAYECIVEINMNTSFLESYIGKEVLKMLEELYQYIYTLELECVFRGKVPEWVPTSPKLSVRDILEYSDEDNIKLDFLLKNF